MPLRKAEMSCFHLGDFHFQRLDDFVQEDEIGMSLSFLTTKLDSALNQML